MQSLRCLTAKVAIDNGFNLIHERNMRPLACCRKPELPFVVESERVAHRSAVIDQIREISVDVTKRVIDKYCTIRQAHNLKVIGSNPIPATRHQALVFKGFLLSEFWPEISFVEASWKRQEESRSAESAELGATQ
jgi:hypothetical protein